MKVSAHRTDIESRNTVCIEVEYNAEIEADRIESSAKLAQFFAFAMQGGEKPKWKTEAEAKGENWLNSLMRKAMEIAVADHLGSESGCVVIDTPHSSNKGILTSTTVAP